VGLVAREGCEGDELVADRHAVGDALQRVHATTQRGETLLVRVDDQLVRRELPRSIQLLEDELGLLQCVDLLLLFNLDGHAVHLHVPELLTAWIDLVQGKQLDAL
jgi:hypothetical protein